MLTEKVHDDLELLSRHVKVLETVKNNQPIGIVRISQLTELDEHEVRHSLSVLEDENLIKPTPQGAIINGDIKEYILQIAGDLDNISSVAKVIKGELLSIL